MKKLLSMLLSILVVATAFVGCTGNDAPDSSSDSKISSKQDEVKGDVKEDPTDIIWMIRSSEPNGKEAVFEQLNAKMAEDMNLNLDMRFIAPGDYDQKMQMAMAGGDEWDLCFTASWANNYVNAAGKGAYLALNDLLDANAPEMMAIMPENFWDGVKVNGDIYAMINYQVMYEELGIQFQKNILDELSIDVSTIKTYDDFLAVLEKVKAEKPEVYPFRGGGDIIFTQTPMTTVMAPFIGFDPATKKLSIDYALDTKIESYEFARAVKEKELQPADAATLKDETTLLNSGQIFARHQRIKPGVNSQLKINTGLDWETISIGKKFINTNAVQSTLTAVNVNSKNPEKAIQLYNYIFTNKDAYNTLCFGIEGTDYNMEGDRVVKVDKAYSAAGWMLGNQFNAMLGVNDEADVWEKTIQGNEEALLCPLYGFVPNRTAIETEMAACESVWVEYKDILGFGLDDPTKAVAEAKEKFESAGSAEVIAELQKQLDVFLASK